MIKIDMEMPKSCWFCRFETQDDLWGSWKCGVKRRIIDYDVFHPEKHNDERYIGCPLIECEDVQTT